MCKLLTYNTVQTALSQLDCPVSPAEVHGLICGMLAINLATDQQLCFQELLEEAFTSNPSLSVLQQLFEHTLQQLNDSNLHFDLLLPEDEEALAKRLFSIQEWGQGLLYGTAVAGLKDIQKLPKDSHEFLHDMSKIVASGELDLEEDEAAEQAYSEIVEYVRIGTLLLSEELQPSKLSTAVH
jgi:uncharacterized protein YgfB (UPF0149 family)